MSTAAELGPGPGVSLSQVTPEILEAMLASRDPLDVEAAIRCGLPRSVLVWLTTGERGISSNTIVQHLTGYPALGRWAGCHPHDTADLRRCMLLLDACPELHRPFFERMADASPIWARLVEVWDDLCEQLGYEMAADHRAPVTAAAMDAVARG